MKVNSSMISSMDKAMSDISTRTQSIKGSLKMDISMVRVSSLRLTEVSMRVTLKIIIRTVMESTLSGRRSMRDNSRMDISRVKEGLNTEMETSTRESFPMERDTERVNSS